MRFKTIDEVLEWVVTFHRALEKRYRRHTADPANERVALLLDYLGEHERALADAIEGYRQQGPAGVLNTWNSSIKDLTFPDTLEQLHDHIDDTDTTTVLRTALQLHDQLIDLYRHMAQTSQTGSTEDLFDNLLRLEKNEQLRLVRHAVQLQDY